MASCSWRSPTNAGCAGLRDGGSWSGLGRRGGPSARARSRGPRGARRSGGGSGAIGSGCGGVGLVPGRPGRRALDRSHRRSFRCRPVVSAAARARSGGCCPRAIRGSPSPLRADGTATLAWNMGTGAGVRVATAPPGRPFGGVHLAGPGLRPGRRRPARRCCARRLALPGSCPDVAAPEGTGAAHPRRNPRAAGNALPAAARTSRPCTAWSLHSVDVEARAAFDPRSGTATVLWPAAAITDSRRSSCRGPPP